MQKMHIIANNQLFLLIYSNNLLLNNSKMKILTKQCHSLRHRIFLSWRKFLVCRNSIVLKMNYKKN